MKSKLKTIGFTVVVLPDPDELTQEIIKNLEAGQESFRAVLLSK